MKKKLISIILITALLLPLLTATAYAADDLTNEDMVDAQGGFFRDIGNLLARGFNNTIENAKSGINSIISGIGDAVDAIGGFFFDLANVINDAFRSFRNFIVDIFLPSKDYFPRIQLKLQTAINNKLGGILSLTEYLKDRFSKLSAPANLEGICVIEFPQGHMFGGTKIDLLMRIRNFIPLIRGLLTSLIVFPTIRYAYRCVRDMIKT